MKLDDKGWGMLSFLIIILLLFSVLLLVAYLINNFDEDFPSSTRRNINYVEINKT